ncbi:MAG: hypothetical protein GKR93_11425 [Gammaproteobacteria bacterium]|nr:hypothetical protein [Gammaproteobacteria bacterium]
MLSILVMRQRWINYRYRFAQNLIVVRLLLPESLSVKILKTVVRMLLSTVLKMIPMEASCYAFLKQRFPGLKKVHFHGAGGVGLCAIVSVQQQAKFEARNILTALLSTQGIKMAIAVDEDVDIFSMDKVMWAVCTRSQADRDLIVLPEIASFQLDPSAPERGVTSAMAIDATKPFGEDYEKVVTIPNMDKLPDITELIERMKK